MQGLREILQEIRSGKTSFRPESSAEAHMQEFQALAKALIFAHKQGYLDGFRSHRESSTRHSWYDAVAVMNGLSYEGEHEGEEFLRNSSLPGNSAQPALDTVVAAPTITLDTHLHILELASRNALPHIINRAGPISFQAACELMDAGHISGLSAQTVNGAGIIGATITLPGRLFLNEQQRRNSSSVPNPPLSVTLDTNCVINLFDRQSASASSVPELYTLIQYSLSGKITIAITTRVETDLAGDHDSSRRSEMLKTLAAFPVIGTVGRLEASKWDGGDVFTDERWSGYVEIFRASSFRDYSVRTSATATNAMT